MLHFTTLVRPHFLLKTLGLIDEISKVLITILLAARTREGTRAMNKGARAQSGNEPTHTKANVTHM